MKCYDSIADLNDLYESTKRCTTEDFIRAFNWYE